MHLKQTYNPLNAITRLVICLALILLLAVVLMRHYQFLEAKVEHAVLKNLEAQLNTAGTLLLADYHAKGSQAAFVELKELIESNPNPMDWVAKYLNQIPVSYKGVMNSDDSSKLINGSWYFENETGHLVYLLRYPDHYILEPANGARIPFRTKLILNGQGIPVGLEIVPQVVYRFKGT